MDSRLSHKKKIVKVQHGSTIRCSIRPCRSKGTHRLTVTTFLSVESSLCDKHFNQFKDEAKTL